MMVLSLVAPAGSVIVGSIKRLDSSYSFASVSEALKSVQDHEEASILDKSLVE